MNLRLLNFLMNQRKLLKALILMMAFLTFFGGLGLILTFTLVCLAFAPRFRFWLSRQPGYIYYASRLPGLGTVEQSHPLKLAALFLFYGLPCSVCCMWLDWRGDRLATLSNWFPLIGLSSGIFVVLATWFIGKWGFRTRPFQIGPEGIGKASRWQILVAGTELDISDHVARETRLRGTYLLGIVGISRWERIWESWCRIWYNSPFLRFCVYILCIPSAIAFWGVVFLPLTLTLAFFPNFRAWLVSQPGYIYRLSRLPGLRCYRPGEAISWVRLTLLAIFLLGLTFLPSYYIILLSHGTGYIYTFLFFFLFSLVGIILLYGLLIQNWHIGSFNQNGSFFNAVMIVYGKVPLIEPVMTFLSRVFQEKRHALQNLQARARQAYNPLTPERGIQQALQTCTFAHQKFGSRSREFVECIALLSTMYEQAGYSETAEWLYERLKELQRNLLGENHVGYVETLHHLGAFYARRGNYRQAEQCYRKAWRAERRTANWNHISIVTTMSSLGNLHIELGNERLAEALFWIALDIHRRQLWNHQINLLKTPFKTTLIRAEQCQYATLIDGLAQFYLTKQDTNQAISLFAQAHDIRRDYLGENHPEYIISLSHLATMNRLTGDFPRAKALASQVVAKRHQLYGERHPTYAEALSNLGWLHFILQEYEQAGPLLIQAVTVMQSIRGREHPDLLPYLTNLSSFYAAIGQAHEAFTTALQMLSIDDLSLSQVLSLGSERQRMNYIKISRLRIDLMLFIISRFYSTSPASRVLGMEFVLRRTALGMETLTVQHEMLTGGGYLEQEKLLRKLQVLAGQIRQLTYDELSNGEARAVDRRKLGELETKREGLEAELTRALPELNLLPRLEHVTCASVAGALPLESALVEFVYYKTSGSDTQSCQARYLAFILRAGEAEQVEMVDLGEERQIDKAIQAFCVSITETKISAEEKWKQKGIALRKLVFDRLLPGLQGCKRLFLVPDGNLNLLAFQVLPEDSALSSAENPSCLLDSYHISYLSAGRDVLRFDSLASKQANAPLVVAAPDFHLIRQKATETGTSHNLEAAISRDFEQARYTFNFLPGALEEGKAIAKLLGIEPLLGPKALKSSIKACQKPRILHIATHGFFLPDQQVQRKQSQKVPEDAMNRLQYLTTQQMENPLLRSGLALAGAENWNQREKLPAEAENGILTADEIASLDLQGTELVVLSACATGNGEIRAGEGVFGLRRAFTLAGAKRLVMSLWHIPDSETKELMLDFYKHLQDGNTCENALRTAQLEAKKRYHHPRYWGAFICQDTSQPFVF